MRKKRVLLLVHEDLVPPEEYVHVGKDDPPIECQTEHDVLWGLRRLGHDVRVLGVHDELAPIRRTVDEWKPHVVFNLLEEFRDRTIFDQHVVAYLELLGVSYTGCNPRGLTLARDKALSKKILHYHRILAPRFVAFHRKKKIREPKKLKYPLFVKSLNEEASLGISQASRVDNFEKLCERVKFIHEKVGTDALAEEFIPGREIYASVIGNTRLTVFPLWELVFDKKTDDMPLINTQKAKWDFEYQQKWGITHRRAKGLDAATVRSFERLSKRIYRRLGLSGYARIDFRLTEEGKIYFLEANPNPDIAEVEEFSSTAKAAGISYEKLLARLIGMAPRF